jgi:hypothetical protein
MKKYIHCPSCRTRMKKTGKKKVIRWDLNDKPIYQWQYECPNCGRIGDYDKKRNVMY